MPGTSSPTDAILVDHELEGCIGSSLLASSGAPPIQPHQVQPASLDLRLGPTAYRIRAGFLPGEVDLADRLEELSTSQLDLTGDGAVLERGLVYLVQLEEEIDLGAGGESLRARFNPRSSTGRCDLFTRVLCPGHPRFDEAPAGYRGPLWIEISPLSFPVRLRRGDRLCQLRLQRGDPALSTEELREVYRDTPLAFAGDEPLAEEQVRFDEAGGLELRLGLTGREPAGWRASQHTDLVDFSSEAGHAAEDFWEPVHARGEAGRARCILAPGSFYIFASRERLRVPPDLAAEMLPVDVGIGELRNNYAGFFDNGFGWSEDEGGAPLGCGTPAVLEVRAHDVPFLVEDGQVFFRLRYFRTSGRPRKLYAQGRSGGSYASQDLTLARIFRPAARG